MAAQQPSKVWQYPYWPTEKQKEAHHSNAEELLFGGSAGGGKSAFVLGSLVTLCLLVPGVQVLALRRTFPDLRRSLIGKLRPLIPAGVATYNDTEHAWKFTNGSRLEMGHLQADKDKYAYQGAEYAMIAFDELTQFTESQYKYLLSRARAAGDVLERMNKLGMKPRVISTANPGGSGHCVPYGDVLTPTGWVPIESMRVGEPVYSVAPDGSLVASVVEQTHQHEATSTVEVNARGFHMHVTPEHRVAKMGGTREATNNTFSLVPWKDLPGQATIMRSVKWAGTALGPVTVTDRTGLRKSRTPQPNTLTATQYARLLGWVISEGCLIDRDYAINIAQMKQPQRDRLEGFLTECGFAQSWTAKGVVIYARAWWQHLKELDFGYCREKYIPQGIKDATPDVLEAVFDSLMDGDGHRISPTSGQYYTISKQLADDVAEVAVKLGYIVHVSSRKRDGREGLSWEVSYKKTLSGGTELLTGHHKYGVKTVTKRRSQVTDHEHNTPVAVYCIGVPEHHSFVIRQKGSVWVSGNSWVKARFIDPAPAGVMYKPQPSEDEPDPLTRCYIKARLQDNPYLDEKQYRRQLQALDPIMRKALLEGNWDILEGVRFSQWRESIHVIKPSQIPIHALSGPKVVCVDYGFSAPFAALWLCKLHDGLVVVYREQYRTELTATQQAELIRDSETDIETRAGQHRAIVMDPAMWRRNDASAPKPPDPNAPPVGSPAHDYQRVLGQTPLRGVNDRLHGWSLLDEKLRVRGDGLPRLLVYDTCRDLIRTLPTIGRDKNNPEDVDTKAEDHILDALRYGLMYLEDKTPVPGKESRPETHLKNITAGIQGIRF